MARKITSPKATSISKGPGPFSFLWVAIVPLLDINRIPPQILKVGKILNGHIKASPMS